MKIYSLLIVCLTLTAMLLTGCGCSNIPAEPMPTTRPVTAPTTRPGTDPTTQPATRETMRPTMEPTMTQPRATIEDGNGPAPTMETKETAKR